MRDSESGLERLAIGHHIGERGHVMERSRNRRTGDREERQDFINLDESESLGQKHNDCLWWGIHYSLVNFEYHFEYNEMSGSTRNKSNIVRLPATLIMLQWHEKCYMCHLKTCPPFPLADAAAFDEEWRREAGRYVPPTARALDYGRDRRGGGQQLALTAPPSSTSPPGHRHESPRHRQPHTRPRYDWWEVRVSIYSLDSQAWISQVQPDLMGLVRNLALILLKSMKIPIHLLGYCLPTLANNVYLFWCICLLKNNKKLL